MDVLISLVMLVFISIIGYKIFEMLQVPAGKIVGPIIIVMLVQMTGITFVIPSIFQIVFSIIFGVFLGLRFDMSAVRQLRRLILPSLVISVIYLILTLGYGTMLTQISAMDKYTSFLAVIPGGVAETSVLAVSFGANLAQVTAFQLLRFLSIVMIVPLLTKHVIIKWLKLESGKNQTKEFGAKRLNTSDDLNDFVVKPETEAEARLSYIWLLIVGAFGSILFKWIQFPAALLLGATFSVSALQLTIKKPFETPPKSIYDVAQVGMGAVIGISFTLESMKVIASLWLPLVVMTVMILISSLLIGLIFSKLFKMDYLTGLMSVLPGGLSTMLVLAEDFDSDIVTISTLQLARLLTAVMVIPILYSLFLY